MACFDQSDVAWSDEWVTLGLMPPPNTTALKCANTTGINYTAVKDCGNGKLGEQLQNEALQYFLKTFPMYATGARFDVPHLYINDVEQTIDMPPSAWTFIKALCNAGSDSDVCDDAGMTKTKDASQHQKQASVVSV